MYVQNYTYNTTNSLNFPERNEVFSQRETIRSGGENLGRRRRAVCVCVCVCACARTHTHVITAAAAACVCVRCNVACSVCPKGGGEDISSTATREGNNIVNDSRTSKYAVVVVKKYFKSFTHSQSKDQTTLYSTWLCLTAINVTALPAGHLKTPAVK